MKFMTTDPPPARNPKAFGLSDLLPAAMVKDLRQSLRSPLYLLLMVLSVAMLYIFMQPRAGYAAHQLIGNWDTLIFFMTVLLVFFVPAHAARSIAGDIRERGSNFLRLCPLSAGRIIWGQFLSGAVQLALLALSLAPLIHSYQMAASPRFSWMVDCGIGTLPAYAFCGLTLLMLYLLALFALAVMMMLAGMPLFLRLLAQLGVGCIFFEIQSPSAHFFNRSYLDPDLAQRLLHSGAFLAILLVIGILCALHLAKRHYCAFVEVRSGWLRLLASLFLFSPLLAIKLVNHEVEFGDFIEYSHLSLGAALIWVLIDELMPRDTAPVKKRRLFPFNRCSSSSSLSCIVLFCGLSVALPHIYLACGLFPAETIERTEHLLRFNAMVGMGCLSTCLFCLMLVQLFFKANSRARLTGFFLISTVTNIFSFQLYFALQNAFKRDCWVFIPFANVNMPNISQIYSNHQLLQAGIVSIICYLLCCISIYARQAKAPSTARPKKS
ncbi:MAG: hypothetical protein R3Y56_06480 [Akkermansia sp.]